MKKWKIALIIFLMLIMILNIINITFSFSTEKMLYYDARKNEITYFNLSKDDLFSSFKGLMPGDLKREQIKFKVDNIKKNTKLYIGIEEDFSKIDYMNLKLYKDKTLLFNSENKTKEEYILLGDFVNNDEFYLSLELIIPKETGNEIENIRNDLKLTFLVESDLDKIEVPSTYDDSNIITNVIIIISSFIIMIILIFKLRKD